MQEHLERRRKRQTSEHTRPGPVPSPDANLPDAQEVPRLHKKYVINKGGVPVSNAFVIQPLKSDQDFEAMLAYIGSDSCPKELAGDIYEWLIALGLIQVEEED